MVIGISGRKDSGKDLVGQIITYMIRFPSADIEWVKQVFNHDYIPKKGSLIFKKTQPKDIPWINDKSGPEFKIVKFADKLKDMVCLLIGCTREQLEDQEFKETPLGEEWERHVLYSDEWDHLKIHDMFDSYEELEKLYGNHKDGNGFYIYKKEQLTPRLILQLLGTDCVRNIIHPQAWVNATFANYRKNYSVLEDRSEPGKIPSHFIRLKHDNWVITDMRFPNELKAVKDRDGISIRVERDIIIPQKDLPSGATVTHNGIKGRLFYNNVHCSKDMAQFIPFKTSLHESETALDNAEFDYVISNNGTISELINQVKAILIDSKVLKDE